MKVQRWPLVIFLFSILTHIPGITSPILDYHAWAQTLRAGIARNYFEGGMNPVKPKSDYIETESHDKAPQFPLYSYLIAVCYVLFGFNDLFGRWISILFAALSAVSLYRLAREIEDERTARAAALVFCVIPIRIYFTRTVMPEAMAIFCLIEGFHQTVLWVRSEKFFPHGILAAGLLAWAVRGQEQKPARIDIEALKQRVDEKKDLFFLDVREPKEIEELGTLKGYVNIPVGQLEGRLSEVPKDRFIVTA